MIDGPLPLESQLGIARTILKQTASGLLAVDKTDFIPLAGVLISGGSAEDQEQVVDFFEGMRLVYSAKYLLTSLHKVPW